MNHPILSTCRSFCFFNFLGSFFLIFKLLFDPARCALQAIRGDRATAKAVLHALRGSDSARAIFCGGRGSQETENMPATYGNRHERPVQKLVTQIAPTIYLTQAILRRAGISA